MKAVVAAAVGAAFVVTPDLAHAGGPGTPFSGSYFGINAGVAFGSSHYKTDPACAAAGTDGVFCELGDLSVANGTAVASSGTGNLSSTGFTGGVQAGYNWQIGRIVVGGEADFGAFDLDKSVTRTGMFPFTFLGDRYELKERVTTNWLATIRGRLGTTLTPTLLLYATGGLALSDIEFSSSYSDNAIDVSFPGGTGSGRKSGVRIGWTVGAGGEWLLDSRWSVKAEYLYVDFASKRFGVPTSNTSDYTQNMRVNADLTSHIARIGLNYRY